MGASLTIDTLGFTRVVTSLSLMSNVPLRKVILSESGKILEKCLGTTPGMSARRIDQIAKRFVARYNTYGGAGRAGQGIRQKPNARDVYPRISVAPGQEHTWWIDRNAGGKRAYYIMSGGRYWSDKRWAQFQAMNAEREAEIERALAQVPRIKNSRGVAKASWLQIGDSLGITLAGIPSYVRAATPRRGPRIDGVARKFESAQQFFVELENRNQMLIGRLKGAGILQRAITGRIKYFDTNMRKGVFDSIEATIKKYPGVFLS